MKNYKSIQQYATRLAATTLLGFAATFAVVGSVSADTNVWTECASEGGTCSGTSGQVATVQKRPGIMNTTLNFPLRVATAALLRVIQSSVQ